MIFGYVISTTGNKNGVWNHLQNRPIYLCKDEYGKFSWTNSIKDARIFASLEDCHAFINNTKINDSFMMGNGLSVRRGTELHIAFGTEEANPFEILELSMNCVEMFDEDKIRVKKTEDEIHDFIERNIEKCAGYGE